ncbi:adenylyltransferase/cytidyltransferase family protein [Pseudonocardia sp. CA-142604]|uniref:adenylyltransferase/cytidyltransferase family protein n=1 Tax=Pseudonocardia sp. CA-142604 TaxID=3240024 RepID=UPI003D9399EC
MTATMFRPAPAATTCWYGTDQIPSQWGRSVVVLGVFDGLHRGHARLLDHAAEVGRRRRRPVVLTTFDPHPATVAGPPRDTTPLVSLDRRVELAHEHGADAVLVLPFGTAMARTPAVDFVHDVLVGSLRATDVVVGANFRFGHRGAGDVRLLTHLGLRHDFTAHGVDLVPGCSSTRVRELLRAGDPARAAEVLGRPHRVRGRCVDGLLRTSAMLPAPGRYRVLVRGHETAAEVRADGAVLLHVPLPTGEIDVTFLDRVEPSS